MKLIFTNRTPRCGYCRHEIVGEGFTHDGVRYCSRSCRELGIYNRSRTREKNWTGLFVAVLSIGMLLGLGVTDAWAHDPYTGRNIPNTEKSCCNKQDCAPARAEFRKGQWWAHVPSRNRWVPIPDNTIVSYKTNDLEAHHCWSESQDKTLCFRPPPTGM